VAVSFGFAFSMTGHSQMMTNGRSAAMKARPARDIDRQVAAAKRQPLRGSATHAARRTDIDTMLDIAICLLFALLLVSGLIARMAM
jgi:hypothetical protein